MTDQVTAQAQDPTQPVTPPGDFDPLARPPLIPQEPDDGEDLADGDGVPDDEDMPLPND